jgi:hypothetical protein
MNTDDFKTEEEFDLYVKGAWDERERIIAMLESLRERYNLESMNLNEIRVAKYEALSSAVALIKGENK